MKQQKTILSGMRPTGKLHIGNYLGALKQFVELQKTNECYFFIADLHSLNEPFEPKIKRAQTIDLIKDYLAAGIDPKKATIFIQSHNPLHSELAIMLSNAIPASYLFRMTQYKEKSTDRSQENVNAGLLFYPVLMAADILLYQPDLIPVGNDQDQHVELARDTAKFFNKRFGKTFSKPSALHTETPRVMSLVNPDKKMSKSSGDAHCIYLDDTAEIINKKLSKAVTDTGDGKGAGAKNLLDLMKIFSSPETYKKFYSDQTKGTIKYSELKQQLALDITNYFSDFRQKKNSISDAEALKVAEQGNKKALKVAEKTIKLARENIGLLS